MEPCDPARRPLPDRKCSDVPQLEPVDALEKEPVAANVGFAIAPYQVAVPGGAYGRICR